MKRLKIAVLFGGCSPEYSVSLQSAAAVLQNMDSSKYEAVMVGMVWNAVLHFITTRQRRIIISIWYSVNGKCWNNPK